MEVRQASHPEAVRLMDTETLRRHFVVEDVFVAGDLRLVYSHHDRMIIGGAVPNAEAISLPAPKPIGQDTFLAERELAAINLGGAGRIVVDGTVHELGRLDCLYVGKGAIDVSFEAVDASNSPKFYLVSAPAHASHPTRLLRQSEVRTFNTGSPETANSRSVFQYVHPEVCQSAQLTLGVTMLKPGSVWNTMPSHTHDRRMEAYLYFDVKPDHRIFHFMGEPDQTRHMLLGNEQAVISPPWSIHSGAGTHNYSFVWAMAGDNKSFTDMDHLTMDQLR